MCWDAPLTGPADPVSAGLNRYDFTKRPIERFFSLGETGFKTPSEISVLGYGAVPSLDNNPVHIGTSKDWTVR